MYRRTVSTLSSRSGFAAHPRNSLIILCDNVTIYILLKSNAITVYSKLANPDGVDSFLVN